MDNDKLSDISQFNTIMNGQWSPPFQSSPKSAFTRLPNQNPDGTLPSHLFSTFHVLDSNSNKFHLRLPSPSTLFQKSTPQFESSLIPVSHLLNHDPNPSLSQNQNQHQHQNLNLNLNQIQNNSNVHSFSTNPISNPNSNQNSTSNPNPNEHFNSFHPDSINHFSRRDLRINPTESSSSSQISISTLTSISTSTSTSNQIEPKIHFPSSSSSSSDQIKSQHSKKGIWMIGGSTRNSNQTKDNQSVKKEYCCPHPGCWGKFARNEHLKRHLRSHNGYKPHTCSICWKSFTRSDNMKQHLKTHSNTNERKTSKTSKNNSSPSKQQVDPNSIAQKSFQIKGIFVAQPNMKSI